MKNRTRLRRFLCLAGTGLLLLALWACNAPFIPVPPSLSPTFEAVTVPDPRGGTHTLYQASGQPLEPAANARFYIYNIALESGVIAKAKADGSYLAPPIDGKLGDPIEIFYQTPYGEQSPLICRKLALGFATDQCD